MVTAGTHDDAAVAMSAVEDTHKVVDEDNTSGKNAGWTFMTKEPAYEDECE